MLNTSGIKIAFISVFSLLTLTVFSQTKNTDDLFKEARTLAFDGKRDSAIILCNKILEKKPNYHDARLLMGRIHAWEKRYPKARKAFQYVIDNKPKYRDAYYAMVDVQLWSDEPKSALSYVNQGLKTHPTDEELLYRKIKILKKLEQYKEAADAAERLLEINPSHEKAQELYESLKHLMRVNRIGISHNIQWFTHVFDRQTLSFVSLARKTKRGSIIGRVNYADRFNRNGFQYEFDAYPKIRKGLYAYVNYGHSEHLGVFPRNRYGMEVYQKLPKSFEFSGGLRHMNFMNSNVTIYTGSISKYFGNYWFSVKPFITPQNVSFSRSIHFFARKYYQNAQNFIGFHFGTGISPDDDSFNRAAGLTFLKSLTTSFTVNRNITKRVILNARLNYNKQQLEFGNHTNVERYSTQLGFRYLF